MSHLHIPDGILPWWLVAIGWILTIGLLVLAARALRPGDASRRVPLVGVISALMLLAMTLEIVPIAYHVNLSVLAGIVLGPALGFVAAFVVDVMLALLGHSGITVVGLNTLVIGAEAVLGWVSFRGISRLLSRGRPDLPSAPRRVGLAAGLATFLSLLLGTLLMIGIVTVSTIDPGRQAPIAESGELRLELPGGSPIQLEPLGSAHEQAEGEQPVDLTTFVTIVLTFGTIGWLIEGILTGLIASYLARVRPDILKA